MKKLITILFVGAFTILFSNDSFAQKENNLGGQDHGNALNVFLSFGDNSAISANYEISISNDFTFAPEAKIWLSGPNSAALGARVDYYFDRILNLHSSWDIWTGIDGSFLLDGDSDFFLNLHAGVEYLFNKSFGVIAEFGGGKASSGGIGIAFHF